MECCTFVALLKVCAKKKDLCEGRRLHIEILRKGLLQKNSYLGSSLISMYAKCGMLAKAQEVLDTLPFRTQFSWNALIAGYSQQGKGHDALGCFERMQNEGLFPDVITYTCIVKACGIIGAISKGKQMHDEISRRGLLEKDVVLGSALVDMYAKCGALTKAIQVLKELPLRNVVSWNALIAGFAQQGQGHRALECLEQMQIEGISPDEVTFISILKACGTIGAIGKGKQVHEHIVNRGLLEKDIVLSSALVDMYAKCGLLVQAREVLERVPGRNVSSWNALISGHVQQEQYHEALDCFGWMQSKGHTPDVVTFTCILIVCGRLRAIDKGDQIYKEIINRGLFLKDFVLCNAMLDMYAKCGELTKAEKVLEEIPSRDVVSWNTLMSGYAQYGQGYKVLNCYELMRSEGFSPDAITFICILRACSDLGAIEKGKEFHDAILIRGLLKDVALGNALVDMYAKFGAFKTAEEVLKDLPVRDVVSWNALISGYAEHGLCNESMNGFERMKSDGLSPDKVTFICILKACASMEAIVKGGQIHDEIVDRCLLEKDIVLGTALVDMYAKCGILTKAEKVLDGLSVRNVACWSALIYGYVQRGKIHEAIHCLEGMQSEGLSPDSVTFICILKACGSTGTIDKGKQIHDHIVRMQLLEKDIVLGNAILDMYAKCGMLRKAQRVLEELPVRDDVSWNTLIVGYAQFGKFHDALDCFDRMQSEGHSPSFVTFICILNVCGNIGAVDKGKQIHEEVESRGLLKDDIVLGNALVDMYAKCGMFAKARQVLEELPIRDVISWSVLIAGYAQQGQGHEALNCLKHMQNEGISPDAITLRSVLNSCRWSGLLNEAQMLYGNMSNKYGICPNLEHHICMVGVYGGAGLFEKAMSVIRAMPSSDYPDVWLVLLGACKKWGNVKLGRLAFDETVKMDRSCATAFVLMTNIFVAAGMDEDARKVDAMRLKYATFMQQGMCGPIRVETLDHFQMIQDNFET